MATEDEETAERIPLLRRQQRHERNARARDPEIDITPQWTDSNRAIKLKLFYSKLISHLSFANITLAKDARLQDRDARRQYEKKFCGSFIITMPELSLEESMDTSDDRYMEEIRARYPGGVAWWFFDEASIALTYLEEDLATERTLHLDLDPEFGAGESHIHYFSTAGRLLELRVYFRWNVLRTVAVPLCVGALAREVMVALQDFWRPNATLPFDSMVPWWVD
ncbi:hypothetical protein ABW21_db0201131 [Orbilia brochopaga]|nr:hypothetical protein ABW21_db0201131 [Drechslerella brochopaga]